jgi:uncharacterized protein YoxC
MEFVPFLWGVIAATIVVVVVYLVRALVEIRKTMVAAREFLTQLNTQLVPVIRETQQVLADVKVTTEGIASRVEDVQSAMTAIGDTGRNISRINCAVGEVADFLSRVSLLSTGVKAAGQYVADKISRRRG